MKENILDLKTCQEMYDSGMTLKEIAEYFGTYKLKIQRLGVVTKSSSEKRVERGNNFQTKETKEKLSKIAKERGLGGTTYKTIYEYKGIKFDSSYELTVAKELDLNEIEWTRPSFKDSFIWFDSKNVSHRYTPDFYLPKYNVYLDPKNDYLITQDKDKIDRVQSQNNIRVLILNKKQLEWKTIATLV